MNRFPTPLRRLTLASAVAALAVVSACSSAPRREAYRADPYASAPVATRYDTAVAQYGVVRDIERVPLSTRSPGAGTLLGGVIGAALGNQVGSGSGRAAATVAGAVGGAMVGNNIENRGARSDDIYRVTVSLQNGDRASFDFRQIDDLRIGDRVRVENGQVYRL